MEEILDGVGTLVKKLFVDSSFGDKIIFDICRPIMEEEKEEEKKKWWVI